jgi:ubiquinone biosynthesis protein
MNRFYSNVRRCIQIVHVCARHLLAHTIGQQIREHSLFHNFLRIDRLSGPQRLRIALEEVGGTFIKFGQVLALQSDIVPLDYCRELFNLLDHVPPFPFEDVEKTFLEELGRKPLEIFNSFLPDPIATGSIGQVHVATLDRQLLAVKVRRPSVLTDFVSDIRLMTFTVRFITALKLKKLYWMIAPITEFVAWTREELDYRHEARYMDAIAKNAANRTCEQVPMVLWEYTTERILTTEYLEALTVLDYMRARDTGDQVTLQRFKDIRFDPDQFARNLIDNFLGGAFQNGMFHADLHPANLMIMPSSTVGYVDFGIAGVLSTYSRHHLVAMTLAYARGDLDQMAESFFRVSAMDANSDVDAFREKLWELSREWYIRDREDTRLRKSITAIMLELLTLSRATGIWPQRDVIKYIRSAIALDGLIKSFAPGFNVGHHLEAVCDRHLHWHSVRSLLSPGSILSWVQANSRLAQDGVLRAVGAMSRFAANQDRVHRPILHHDRRTQGASVRLAALALVTCMLTALPHEHLAWGFNPRSVGMVLVFVSAFLTLWKMRRPPNSTGDTNDIDNADYPRAL